MFGEVVVVPDGKEPLLLIQDSEVLQISQHEERWDVFSTQENAFFQDVYIYKFLELAELVIDFTDIRTL